MKKFVLVIILLISCIDTKKSNSVNKLEFVNVLLKSKLLDSIYNYNTQGWNNSAIHMKAEKIDEKNIIKLTILDKENFFLSNKNEKAYGYFEFHDATIIVFTDNKYDLFIKENRTKEFNFLNKDLKKSENRKKYEIPEIYEPISWIYEYDSERFVFKDTEFY